MMASLSGVAAQSEGGRRAHRRARRAGAVVTGNLKFDIDIADTATRARP
jgi:hypothetical protein